LALSGKESIGPKDIFRIIANHLKFPPSERKSKVPKEGTKGRQKQVAEGGLSEEDSKGKKKVIEERLNEEESKGRTSRRPKKVAEEGSREEESKERTSRRPKKVAEGGLLEEESKGKTIRRPKKVAEEGLREEVSTAAEGKTGRSRVRSKKAEKGNLQQVITV
jgi:hypothetical protein